MNKRDMLECLINTYAGGNKSRFASRLGVKPQTINSWLLRNTFDIELVYNTFEDISADWLLSGEGEVVRSPNKTVGVVSETDKELLQLCKLLIGNFQQRDELLAKLSSKVKYIEG